MTTATPMAAIVRGLVVHLPREHHAAGLVAIRQAMMQDGLVETQARQIESLFGRLHSAENETHRLSQEATGLRIIIDNLQSEDWQ